MRKLILVIFVAAVWFTAATQPSAPTQPDGLIGRWVGFETQYWVFYDLNLQAGGFGSLVVLNEDGSPDVYRLHWGITNTPRVRIGPDQRNTMQVLHVQTSEVVKGLGRLNMSSRNLESLTLRFTVVGEFVENGTTNHWEREALLVKEKDIVAKIAESAKYEPKQ